MVGGGGGGVGGGVGGVGVVGDVGDVGGVGGVGGDGACSGIGINGLHFCDIIATRKHSVIINGLCLSKKDLMLYTPGI
jgi:hypothetical protein